jgi:branched-chain amino acid transport system permease protein
MKQPCGTFNTSYAQEMAIARTRFQIIVAIVAAVLFFGAAPFILNAQILSKINIIGIVVVGAIGLQILTGYCGQLNFGQSAFLAIGAFISAMLCKHLGWNWFATVPMAVVGTALIGLIFGLPSLRIKGFYIAVTTMAAFFIVMFVLIRGGAITGGISGLQVSNVQIGDLVFDNEQKFFYLIMFFVVLAVFFAKNLVRGRVGRAFVAIRDNDLAAELMGINIFKYKLIAFIACSAYAGLAGSLFAAYYGYVSADQFTLSESVWYIGYLIVGGLGSITGTIFGVVFLKVVEFILRGIGPTISEMLPAIGTSFLSSSLVMVFGLIIIIFLIFEPRGLYHKWELAKASIRFWPFTY